MLASPTPRTPKGCPGLGNLHDDRIDHGKVQSGGHPVVQEAAVGKLTVVVVVVLLIEGPADTLGGATLQLAFDVAGVNGLTRILHRRVTQDFYFARLGVHLLRRR